ncbi:LPS assembly protein LptD [Vibrio algicola]|uniref:LPS-assembly protein LptD n=1 Tax=Vibrio algicola TaxID=2662262 RepID=A0A5Q0THF3_9VIBR|nr:LPS assembly protein LptD [Vibrio algicola]
MLRLSRTFFTTLLSAAFLSPAFADDSSRDSVSETAVVDAPPADSSTSNTPLNESDSDDSASINTPPVDQCIDPASQPKNSNSIPVNIQADSVTSQGQNQATYHGNVVVTQGHKTITADKVTLNQANNTAVADGNVVTNDGQIKSQSTKVNSDLKGNRVELYNTKYNLLCQTARGDAAYILKDGQAIYSMQDGSLTTCPEDNKSWRVKASDIDIDNDEQEATFYNTRFEVQDIPIFYWPYITVPIGAKRKTGFLYPNAAYDTKNGLELNIPIYFNLAPNYDLTTTVNYMQKRGTQFENEFRYRTDGFGAGSAQFEYLNKDGLYTDKGARWGGHWQHEGIYNRHWKFSVDYAKISDNTYLDDLDSNIGKREDGQLNQIGEVNYRTEFSDTTLKVRNFQVLTNNKPYRLLPQLGFKYYRPRALPHLDFEWNSHISRFETDNDKLPDATRLHMEPGVILPFSAPWGQLTSEAKVMYTYYDQDLKNTNVPKLKEHTQRVVPEFRINGNLFMDSNEKFFGDYTQTIEPRLQYLYIPKVDQDEIYHGYDTTLMPQDYYGLFRDMKYSSVDYIASANQLSYGATSRFYDADFKERFNISLGQILYLTPSEESDNSNNNHLSAWALENEWNISDKWQYKGGLQYDSNLSNLQQANSTLEYKLPTGYTQLNYRYTSKDYIQQSAPNILESQLDSYTRSGISQLGALTKFKITKRLDFNASYYYDLTENNMLEGLAGVTYNDDCWFLGVTYSHHIMSSGSVENVYAQNGPGPEYEGKVSINIGIKGLGTSAGLAYSDGGNSLSYGRPFSLN